MSEEKDSGTIAEYYRETQDALVKPTVAEMLVMDRYDEMQVVADIKEGVAQDIIAAWVYQTRGGQKELTYNAIRHWANIRAQQGFPISINDVQQLQFADKIATVLDGFKADLFTEKEAKEKVSYYTDYLFVQVKSVSGEQSRFGFAEQCIYDKGKIDDFAFRKACGKAQRNAIKEFMTAEEKAAIIALATIQGRKPIIIDAEFDERPAPKSKKQDDQPASEKQKSELEFLLAEKNYSITECEQKLTEKFAGKLKEGPVKIDFSDMTAKKAAWLIKEIQAL